MPGTADDTVVVHFGYGRKRAGKVGNGIGVDAFPLRTSKAPWFDGGATSTSRAGQHESRPSQNHFVMEGRQPRPRRRRLEEFRKDPEARSQELGHRTSEVRQDDHALSRSVHPSRQERGCIAGAWRST